LIVFFHRDVHPHNETQILTEDVGPIVEKLAPEHTPASVARAVQEVDWQRLASEEAPAGETQVAEQQQKKLSAPSLTSYKSAPKQAQPTPATQSLCSDGHPPGYFAAKRAAEEAEEKKAVKALLLRTANIDTLVAARDRRYSGAASSGEKRSLSEDKATGSAAPQTRQEEQKVKNVGATSRAPSQSSTAGKDKPAAKAAGNASKKVTSLPVNLGRKLKFTPQSSRHFSQRRAGNTFPTSGF
jgi:hypothetical protein